jgi:hypothetical protein
MVAAGSGPSGVTWLQLATVSMTPAASAVAKINDRRGEGWEVMSWVLLGRRRFVIPGIPGADAAVRV